MRKQRCGDCGCVLEKWSTVYRWRTGSWDVYVCECCLESRIGELGTLELAQRMGVTCCTAEELGR